jgi:23S rRNA (adenine2030-N6)-methyltransferase
MLSYQHIYHAGNLADVHKHGALAWMLAYLTRKDKPVSYIETHAGRALYDLADPAAIKTGEAAAGIAKALDQNWFAPTHPYVQALTKTRAEHGDMAYPGSPMLAKLLLRPSDSVHLAELHPQEKQALDLAISGAQIYQQDGFAMAQAITPPTPRRGLMVIDPSYEIKSDYATIPQFIAKIAKKWNVGTILLWYPILIDGPHDSMIAPLAQKFPDALDHRVTFPPARDGHRMVGSGLFCVNPPFGLDDELDRLAGKFAQLS